MGLFFFGTIINTRESKKDELSILLERWKTSGELFAEIDDLDSYGDWTILPDLELDNPEDIAERISNELETSTLSVVIADSDYAKIDLFDNNQKATLQFGDVEEYGEEEGNQNIELFEKCLVEPYKLEDIKKLLSEEYIFVEDAVYKLLEMMGIKVIF